MPRSSLSLAAAAAVCLVALPIAAAAAADAPAEWAARHILVSYKGAERSGATRTKDEARELAAKAAAEAQAPGADFEALSHKYSDDRASDAQGGFLGYFPRGQMTPKFQEVVEALAEGQVSGVVETPFGFHVIQRLCPKDADEILFKNRSVIVAALFPWKGASKDPTVTRSKEMALEDATKAMEHLRAGGTFESIPPVYGAVPFRGGWQAAVLPRGALRPDFKALGDEAFAVTVGSVGKPVESPVGFVVLKRVPYFRMHIQHLVVLYKGGQASDSAVTRSKEQAQARAEEALKRYEAKPDAWQAIVGEYSDEPGALERSGDLRIAEPGAFVPAFDAGIAALQIGDHTKVFETPFGFHVARRIP